MRRLLSDAVQVRPPLPTAMLLDPNVSPEYELRANLPTETEIRDAGAKLARQMVDMVTSRTAGQEGWKVGDMTLQLVELSMGELALRGSVIIERPDA